VSQVPELRYSSLKVSRENGVKVYDYVARLGKQGGEVVRYLVEDGGTLTVGNLADTFGGETVRPRDFVRRRLGPLAGHRERGPSDHTEDEGADPPDLLTGPPIIIIGDAHRVRDRTVTLADNYLAAIEMHREIGGEIEANRLQEQKIQKQREAYRNRSKVKPDPAPSETEMDQRRDRLHRDRKDRAVGTFARKRRGPRINLEIYLAGNYRGAEFEGYFVNSVLTALGEPWADANAWRVAVLEAAEDQRGESVPETVEPAPVETIVSSEAPEKEGNIHTMPAKEATESPRTDAPESPKGVVPALNAPDDKAADWTTHEISCECVQCLSPMVSYAKPQPYRTDSVHPDNRSQQRLTSAA
jgi:hypothetical protein